MKQNYILENLFNFYLHVKLKRNRCSKHESNLLYLQYTIFATQTFLAIFYFS